MLPRENSHDGPDRPHSASGSPSDSAGNAGKVGGSGGAESDRVPSDDRATTRAAFDRVYAELRELAHSQMRHERAGLTLQPTALVHEVYLRLSRDEGVVWENSRHFFAAAAEAMRRILVERARRIASRKHGGGRKRVELSEGAEAIDEADPGAMISLDEAMEELRAFDPQLAEVAMLRYFAGLSVERTAEMMGRSERSVKYDWAAARAWLLRRMDGDGT
ncbi:MAG: sigma-70 family RNA polymerase sigma factor [Phycisphaeraceae bacterium]|nr:sigma-70 family RNA polymerase sigma factor [Phycisphaeraceae bacterium]MBX3368240.1 sigma-70 family RNA polymerase sigma factor [Phycisphaeraceae bacterium]